jgi:glycosyltransferase involved in cell wall biosynthesis
MKVLMLSLDPNILHQDRSAGKRMVEYAGLVERLTVVLFSSGGPVLHSLGDGGNLTIYPTSRFKPFSFLKGFWLCFRELRRGKYDLITLQEPFALSFIAFPMARLFNLPLEVQVHSTFFSPFWKESRKNTFYQFLGSVFVPRATCIRSVSERIKADLMQGLSVSESKIAVLPIFTDAKRFADAKPSFDLHAKYLQFDFIALTASRLVKQKNIELAISAVKTLAAKHPRTGLVIVGAGLHEEELRGQCAGFEKNIVFEGWSDDVVSYYKGADVFLLPSNYEGWAMSVIEAMASGTAVVMTDVGCAGEVVRNGENGVVIPIGDGTALVLALERLYTNPHERKRLAEAGRKTVLSLKPRTWGEYLLLYKKNWQDCVTAHVQK